MGPSQRCTWLREGTACQGGWPSAVGRGIAFWDLGQSQPLSKCHVTLPGPTLPLTQRKLSSGPQNTHAPPSPRAAPFATAASLDLTDKAFTFPLFIPWLLLQTDVTQGWGNWANLPWCP